MWLLVEGNRVRHLIHQQKYPSHTMTALLKNFSGVSPHYCGIWYGTTGENTKRGLARAELSNLKDFSGVAVRNPLRKRDGLRQRAADFQDLNSCKVRDFMIPGSRLSSAK